MAVTLVIRMAHVVFTARMLVGATLVFYGLNDLVEWFEPDYGRKGGRLLSAIADTGYLLELKASLMILSGLLFMVARWVPLALVLFSPILLNMLAFHAFLAPTKITFAAILGGLQLFLAYCYWPYFRALFVLNSPSRYGTVRRRGGAPPRRPSGPPGGGGGGAPVGMAQPAKRPAPQPQRQP